MLGKDFEEVLTALKFPLVHKARIRRPTYSRGSLGRDAAVPKSSLDSLRRQADCPWSLPSWWAFQKDGGGGSGHEALLGAAPATDCKGSSEHLGRSGSGPPGSLTINHLNEQIGGYTDSLLQEKPDLTMGNKFKFDRYRCVSCEKQDQLLQFSAARHTPLRMLGSEREVLEGT